MTTPDELRAQAAALEAQAAQLETPLTADDVHRLYVERNYQAIEDARRAGRLNNLFNPNKEKTA
jgi:hypothetical protein